VCQKKKAGVVIPITQFKNCLSTIENRTEKPELRLDAIQTEDFGGTPNYTTWLLKMSISSTLVG
jgi:hypothetical protein